MPPKRVNGVEGEEMTGREKKKLKVNAARTIAVQSGFQRETSYAGPSNTAAHATNSLKGLPTVIDIEKFVEARAFEIDAMHTAMKTASASSTHRVWQTLPRHLRRRAASHDVKRVPLRLRDRARAEMDPMRKKALGRSLPKLGRGKSSSRTESFLKRQREKSWLESHIWHAKRMHMENLWGYRLAVSPTEKSYRPSHRASVHGSILHDASYYCMYEVNGPEEALGTLLDLCCDPQGPGPSSKRYLNGSRVLETCMYSVGSYPYGLIAPLTVMWRPHAPNSSEKSTPKSLGNNKAKDVDFPRPSDIRSVWLRFHPSVRTSVFNTLKDATSRSLNLYKNRHSHEARVEVIDLRGQLNIFEIMGPKSSQVIKGALSPIPSESSRDFLQFWKSLTNLQSSGSNPRGMIIGFKVNDPRLKFPPKNAKPIAIPFNGVPSVEITLPSASLANCQIWDESTRSGLLKPRFQKKDIDARRATSAVPGMALNALRQDDSIPILLIQRSIETSNSDSKGLHGWTLILPAGWSMAFFSSLVYTNTRVAGQLERQTQAYEAGTAYFPRDYPFTEPYKVYALQRELKEKEIWERKPPAKRVNFEKLGTENPYKSNWDRVLGISEQHVDNEAFVTAQRDPEPENQPQVNVLPWLLRGPEVPRVLSDLSSVFNVSAALLSEINRLRLKRGHQTLSEDVNGAQLLHGALVNVKITMCSRGSPQDLAEIFILSDDLLRQWERFLQTRTRDVDVDHPDELELASRIPPPSSIIGYVTTGHYSLARGEGFAIGAIALTRLLELEQQASRLHPNQSVKNPPMFVVMRNLDGHQCRVARLQVLLDA